MIINYPLFFLRLVLIWLAIGLAVYSALFAHQLGLYALAMGIFLLTLWFFDKRDAHFEAMYNAHWATPEEITDMFVKTLRGREILLGYAYGKTIALKENLAGKKELGHVLVVGPSRAGKGLHASANLLNWTGSVVVIDIKGEFYNNTAGYREQVMGQDVFVLNPSTGALTNQFDPFAERESDEQLLATATAILNPDADGSNKAFGLRATFILFALTKTAKLRGYAVLPFVRECISLGIHKCTLLLAEATNDESVHRNLSFFVGCPPNEYDWDGVQNDKFLNNSWMNLISKLTYLLSDGVVEMTQRSDFKATDLVRKPMSLYMVFRESDLKYTVHSFSAVMLSIIESIIKYYDLHPEEKMVPILFIFDEAGRITIPELPELTSTVAGRGMVAMIYVQALSQLETTYQRTGADTIKANTHTKIYFTPKDEGTAKYISANAGKYMIEDQRHTIGDASNSDSTGLSSRELITVNQVQEMSGGRVLIHSNEFPYIAAYRLEPFPMAQFSEAKKHAPPIIAPRKTRESSAVHALQRSKEGSPAEEYASVAPAPVAPPPADDAAPVFRLPFVPSDETTEETKAGETSPFRLPFKPDGALAQDLPFPSEPQDDENSDDLSTFR